MQINKISTPNYNSNFKAVNMKYFKDAYPDETQRYRILKLFPKDFQKGYKLYINGKLIPDFPGDESGWYILDPKSTIKFNINE